MTWWFSRIYDVAVISDNAGLPGNDRLNWANYNPSEATAAHVEP